MSTMMYLLDNLGGIAVGRPSIARQAANAAEALKGLRNG